MRRRRRLRRGLLRPGHVALRDPDWASNEQWGGMVGKIIADIATDERRIRVAAHGTHFRVERSGSHVVVDVTDPTNPRIRSRGPAPSPKQLKETTMNHMKLKTFAASLLGLPVLIMVAMARGDTLQIVACSVFATTLILLYGASTAYHAVPHARAKRILRVVDHVAIERATQVDGIIEVVHVEHRNLKPGFTLAERDDVVLARDRFRNERENAKIDLLPLQVNKRNTENICLYATKVVRGDLALLHQDRPHVSPALLRVFLGGKDLGARRDVLDAREGGGEDHHLAQAVVLARGHRY